MKGFVQGGFRRSEYVCRALAAQKATKPWSVAAFIVRCCLFFVQHFRGRDCISDESDKNTNASAGNGTLMVPVRALGEENYFAYTAIPDAVGLTEAQLAAALK